MENWVNQMRNFICTIEQLESIINLSDDERKALNELPARWGTTPYFASLMDPNDPNCPIRKQIVPTTEEFTNTHGITNYLKFKENHSPIENRPNCIGRQYKDRVAFIVTDSCGIYCRHCFRKELIIDRKIKFRLDLEEGLQWIRNNSEIRDVLITGGDPFLLNDEQIEYLLVELRSIPHIEMIRIGTRVPVVLPQRINSKLLNILKRYSHVPIWINIQCNHAKEITDKTAKAVYDLLSCGISIGNQSVLLKGINDDEKTFKELNQKLLSIRVRPYYLFYCEQAPNIDHFRTTVERGLELIQNSLQGYTTGLAQPMYVVATNIGKIPLNKDYIVKKSDKDYVLRNYKGQLTTLPVIG